jgi:DNA-binding transcriptional regulator YiaG
MREALFAELQESVRDAVDHRKGARVSRADRFRRPKKLKPAEIRSIRIKWGVKQLVFGKRLGASVRAVRAWEQGKRRPRGIALQLLSIAQHSPAAFLQEG